MPKIKITKDTTVYSGKFLDLILRQYRGVKGKNDTWEMVQRKTYGRIIGVVPITTKNEIVLVRIYRVPLRAYIIELCAGLMDRKGEGEEAVARRELLEETGYTAPLFQPFIRGPFNAGLSEDSFAVYLARGAHLTQVTEHGNSEEIEVLKIPLRSTYRFLTHPPRNTKVDLKLFGILYLLTKKGYRC